MRRRVIGLLVVLVLAWGGLAALLANDVTPKLGLDLQGGVSVLLTAPEGTPPEVLEEVVARMRLRIEDLGSVQEPEIQVQGGNSIFVQLPGVSDEERALNVIGKAGVLSFRPVIEAYWGRYGPYGSLYVDPNAVLPTTTSLPAESTDTTSGENDPEVTVPDQEELGTTIPDEEGIPATTIPDNLEETATTTVVESTTTTVATTTTTTIPPSLVGKLDPLTGLSLVDDPAEESFLAHGDYVYHLAATELTGDLVTGAVPSTQDGLSWYVVLDFDSRGGDLFAELTGTAAGFPTGTAQRQIAIVLDGEIISAPAVESDIGPEGITGGSAIVTLGSGGNPRQEAIDLASLIKYGSLPVSFLDTPDAQKISATLGQESLRIGLLAGLLGLCLVALYLLIFYRSLGLVAIVGLGVFGAFLISVFGILGVEPGVTLTLAGVTGIVVSVGITCDSYIVYFERIKDEIREGKNVPSAVTDGFKKAFRTILTADTVSLIGAVLIYFLAVGNVRGFALALGIATFLDIVIARVYTRRAVWIIGHLPFGKRGAFSIAAVAGSGKEEGL